MKRSSYIPPILALLVVAVGIGGLILRSGGEMVFTSPEYVVLGTYVQFQVVCKDEDEAYRAIMAGLEEIDRIDEVMSTYRDDSELSELNQAAANGTVEVSEELFYVLSEAKRYYELTGGAFDITVGPLIRVWKTAGAEERLPYDDEIEGALAVVGMDAVRLNDGDGRYVVEFEKEGIELNVDALAKGYAVDRALAVIKGFDVSGGQVNIGGEVGCFINEGAVKDHWTVGVQKPIAVDGDGEGEIRWTVRVRNEAVATSGNYRRYVSIGGRTYSHIIDPRNGEPAEKVPSVTVIAGTVMEADALATALSVMAGDDGIELAEALEVEAMIVVGIDPVEVMMTDGFEGYVVK